MLARDTVIQQRYRVVRGIGRGGMGAVYEVIDERLGRRLALKQMTVSGEKLMRAFEQEARLLASLSHANLPQVYDHFSDSYGQFLVMEYIPGPDLRASLTQRAAPFEISDVVHWADQLLDVLEYLHRQEVPVIHRDIKPANIKIRDGQVKLLDFGLTKGNPDYITRISLSSITGYTLKFAPPEQIRHQTTDARSDLFSLAATLYSLLTGEDPADVPARWGGLNEGMGDPLCPATDLNPQVPRAISDLLLQAMAMSYTRPPASATVMRHALREAVVASKMPGLESFVTNWASNQGAQGVFHGPVYLYGSSATNEHASLDDERAGHEPPQPAERERSAEQQVPDLERARDHAMVNLRLVRKRMAEYVASTEVPLHLHRDEQAYEQQIADLEKRIAALQASPDSLPSRSSSLDYSEPVDNQGQEPATPSHLTGEEKQADETAPVPHASAVEQLRHNALMASFNQDWEQAELLLSQVVEADGTDEDAQAKLRDARRQQLQQQYRQVSDLRDTGQWQAVLNVLSDLERKHTDYPDPDGHRTWAEAQQQREQHYAAALEAYEQADWPCAVAALEALVCDFPHDEMAQTLLMQVQQQESQHHPYEYQQHEATVQDMPQQKTAEIPMITQPVLTVDIVDFSIRSVQSQTAAVQELIRMLGEAIPEEHNNKEARMWSPAGDGGSITFWKSILPAIHTAIRLAQLAEEYNQSQPPDKHILLRIGLHSGPVSCQADFDGRENVWGDGINTSARLIGLARPGQILASDKFVDDAQLTMFKDIDIQVHDIGKWWVKHNQSIHVYNIHSDNAGIPISHVDRWFGPLHYPLQQAITTYEGMMKEEIQSRGMPFRVAVLAKRILDIDPDNANATNAIVSISQKEFRSGIAQAHLFDSFFSPLSPDALLYFFRHSRFQTYKPEEMIAREGDRADKLMIIVSGDIELFKKGSDGYDKKLQVIDRDTQRVHDVTFSEGAIVGEMGLFNEATQRTATLKARHNVITLTVEYAYLRVVESSDPADRSEMALRAEIQEQVWQYYCERTINTQLNYHALLRKLISEDRLRLLKEAVFLPAHYNDAIDLTLEDVWNKWIIVIAGGVIVHAKKNNQPIEYKSGDCIGPVRLVFEDIPYTQIETLPGSQVVCFSWNLIGAILEKHPELDDEWTQVGRKERKKMGFL